MKFLHEIDGRRRRTRRLMGRRVGWGVGGRMEVKGKGGKGHR